jgi:hypothetical protein
LREEERERGREASALGLPRLLSLYYTYRGEDTEKEASEAPHDRVNNDHEEIDRDEKGKLNIATAAAVLLSFIS